MRTLIMASLAWLCATSANAASLPVPLAGSVRTVMRPELGVVTSKEVGEALFENEVVTTYEALIVPPGSRLTIGRYITVELKGDAILSQTDRSEKQYCAPATPFMRGRPVPAAPPLFCQSVKEYQRYGGNFALGQTTRHDAENFRRELLYQGKVGRELKLSYREFVGDLARPAFTQEVSFDLSEGETIGVKGARIEVIEANNIAITYRVLQPFSRRP